MRKKSAERSRTVLYFKGFDVKEFFSYHLRQKEQSDANSMMEGTEGV